VEDIRYRGFNRQMMDFYLPFKQNPLAEYLAYQDVMLKTSVEPLALVKPMQQVIYSLDPNQPIASSMTATLMLSSVEVPASRRGSCQPGAPRGVSPKPDRPDEGREPLCGGGLPPL
jgi:hypothetical protein